MRSRWRVALLLVAALAPAACGGGDDGTDDASATTTTTEVRNRDREREGRGDRGDDRGDEAGAEDAGGDAGDAEIDEDGGGDRKDCDEPTSAEGLEPVEAVELPTDGPAAQAVVYPHPDYEGEPWSQWGVGVEVDGTFFSAIGDHCGRNGNSYLFGYDPDAGVLEALADVLSVTGHEPGAWGYGKIHAPMVEGDDGAVYLTTYWGSHEGIEFADGYEGDRLLRIDPATGEVTDLGAPMPGLGIPSIDVAPGTGLLYGEAVDPVADPKESTFFAYDLDTGEVVATVDKGATKGARDVLVDADGRAWFSTGDEGELTVFDPGSRESEVADVAVPGRYLRASTVPAPDGTVYGVTHQPDELFALHPDGTIDDLGPAGGYVAALALSDDGSTVYFVPGAHGAGFDEGTPVMALDVATGDLSVLVELADAGAEALDLALGGSYDVAVSDDGERLYVGLNAGPAGSDERFGTVVLVTIEL